MTEKIKEHNIYFSFYQNIHTEYFDFDSNSHHQYSIISYVLCKNFKSAPSKVLGYHSFVPKLTDRCAYLIIFFIKMFNRSFLSAFKFLLIHFVSDHSSLYSICLM